LISLKWKEIAELLGLAAILSGMYFVYTEIQQNRTISRVEMNSVNRGRLDEIRVRVLEPEFSVLYLKGAQTPTDLNESERQMLNAHFESLFTVMSSEFHNHRLGIFDEYANLQRWIAQQYFVRGYGRAYWNVRKKTFIPEVVAIVDEELSKIDSAPPSDFDEEILKQLANP